MDVIFKLESGSYYEECVDVVYISIDDIIFYEDKIRLDNLESVVSGANELNHADYTRVFALIATANHIKEKIGLVNASDKFMCKVLLSLLQVSLLDVPVEIYAAPETEIFYCRGYYDCANGKIRFSKSENMREVYFDIACTHRPLNKDLYPHRIRIPKVKLQAIAKVEPNVM